MKLLEARPLAQEMESTLKERVAQLAEQGRRPKLVAVASKPDEASQAYLSSQAKIAQRLGIEYKVVEPSHADERAYLGIIRELNEDTSVNGVILLTPLPSGVNEMNVLVALSPQKDVEGITPHNLGSLFYERETMAPCTAEATLRLAEYYGVGFFGKNVVIIGRSVVVGKPLALMLLKRSRSATVTVCHTKTRDLTSITKKADILIVAAGRPKLIGREHVPEGCVVLDVGINSVDGKLVGDVDFEAVKDVVSAITPVPGGVGRITTLVLMEHVVKTTETVVSV
ncbi:MAG: bifunctional 5,10-methylenetetrahydrofolate dehydrogenase/5,10-methenyltetrahydrofolate cyclohydrolase [Thermotogae bacterium]|nr:bifunctional 5,10-methylenetetrahydrofolate dehydrogenase/5,10-methenyltetrahydrofolate cyclohydrolase [Thermotogota bacterium]